jgi:tetrapyrrole methylase family protein/MazG family protein
MTKQQDKRLPHLAKLVDIMARLRAPDGCPWDKVQTHKSLRPYLIEEAYEVLNALETENMEALKSELGDLLLQIIFHAQIAEENGDFNLDEVAKTCVEKLIRRHPHIFGDVKAETSETIGRR